MRGKRAKQIRCEALRVWAASPQVQALYDQRRPEASNPLKRFLRHCKRTARRRVR